MMEVKIIYGCDLPKLTEGELLQYFQDLTEAIAKGWDFEGRYILRDYTKYEILNRMGAIK